MAKLDTAHGPYVELMGLGRVFVVPDYQRAYSWKASKQVAELWSDILRLYRSAVDEGITDTHFIGSVVIGSASTKALGPVECPVIDGQQRLITLSLIVAAIRDALVVGPDDKTALTAQYLAHYKGDVISAVRVRPGSKDRVTFDAIIKGEEDYVQSRSLVYRAYQHLIDQLRKGPAVDLDPDEVTDETETLQEVAEEEAADDLQDEGDTIGIDWDWEQLLSVVGTQLELVSISDVAPENAYQIFATLNSTGLPLAQVDLIRNAIFLLMPKTGALAHKELWVPLENAMGKELLQSYLHTWVIRRGHNVPAKESYRRAESELSRAGTQESDIRKQLKELNTGAWAYLAITRPNSDERSRFVSDVAVSKPMLTSLLRLREWGTVPMESVLVEILERMRTDQLTPPQAQRLLLLLESFVVRRFIAQTPPNDLRSIFARLTQQIRKKTSGAAFEKALIEGLQETARRWPTDMELVEAMVRRPLYRRPGQKQSFFVLKGLAEKYEGKEVPHVVAGSGASEYSIEHVLPQSFPDHWRDDLTTWGDPNPQETWTTHRHTAGNLTLTAYNSELAALPFEDRALGMDKKRWIGGHLRLKISKSILADDKWTRAEIEARSREMGEMAKQIWPRA